MDRDFNEARVFFVLIGRRRLVNIGVSIAILEGDSVCAIRWVSGITAYVGGSDCTDEIWRLVLTRGCSISHIFRTGNMELQILVALLKKDLSEILLLFLFDFYA